MGNAQAYVQGCMNYLKKLGAQTDAVKALCRANNKEAFYTLERLANDLINGWQGYHQQIYGHARNLKVNTSIFLNDYIGNKSPHLFVLLSGQVEYHYDGISKILTDGLKNAAPSDLPMLQRATELYERG